MAVDTSIYAGLDTSAPYKIAKILSPSNIENQRINRLMNEEKIAQAQEAGALRNLLRTAGTTDPSVLADKAMQAGLYQPARQFQSDAAQQAANQAKMDELQRKQAMEKHRQMIGDVSDQALMAKGATPEQIALLPKNPWERRMHYASQVGDANLLKMVTPAQKVVGDYLYTVDPWTGQTINREEAPKKVDYNKPFLPSGEPNVAYQQYAKEKARAGAANTSIHMPSPDKKFSEQFGTLAAKGAMDTLEAGDAARATLDNVTSMRSALGKARLGPGATLMNSADQVAYALGVGGRDTEERLRNTATMMSSMAKEELNAAAAMKGQGQITESERAILRKASTGDIGTYTLPQLQEVLNVTERLSKERIRRAGIVRKNLEKMPEFGTVMGVLPQAQSTSPATIYTSKSGATIEPLD